MQEYAIRSSHASTIAVDQHARSVAMRALDISTGETRCAKLAGCPTAGDSAAHDPRAVDGGAQGADPGEKGAVLL